MDELGLRPGPVADQAGVGHTFVYDIMYGRSQDPAAGKLLRVANVLKTSLEYLVTGVAPGDDSSSRDSGDRMVAIPFVNVTASMGGGAYVDGEPPSDDAWFLSQEWVRREFNTSPGALRLIHVKGDSMEPTIRSGSVIIVDTSNKNPSQGGIFVLDDGGGLVAKRLEFVFGSTPLLIRIASDNQLYPAYDCRVGDVRIIGRVVWVGWRID
jgi:phage repressor protein C with HTH and peptisase S24 domain